jgi:hypothetical protein
MSNHPPLQPDHLYRLTGPTGETGIFVFCQDRIGPYWQATAPGDVQRLFGHGGSVKAVTSPAIAAVELYMPDCNATRTIETTEPEGEEHKPMENYEDVIGDIGAMIGELATTTDGQTIKARRGAYKPKTELGTFVQKVVNETMEKVRRGERISAFQIGDRVKSPDGTLYTIATSFWCNPKNVNDTRPHGVLVDDDGQRITLPMYEIRKLANLTTEPEAAHETDQPHRKQMAQRVPVDEKVSLQEQAHPPLAEVRETCHETGTAAQLELF